MAKDQDEDKDEGEAEEEALVEVDRIGVLEAKLKTNRIIIIIFCFICFLFISVVVTGLVLLGKEIYSLPPDPLAIMQEQIDELDQDQESLGLKINNHLTQVRNVSKSINAIDFNYNRDQIKEIENVLLRQEKDYQYLLVTLGKGVSSIANMLKGSKRWKQDHRERIEKALEESKRREEDIKSMLDADLDEQEEDVASS